MQLDNKKAFYWLEKAANQGDSAAQEELARDVRQRIGIAQNDTKAFHWYNEAAKQVGCLLRKRLFTATISQGSLLIMNKQWLGSQRPPNGVM